MKNFKQIVLNEINEYKEAHKEGIFKYYIEENNYTQYMTLNKIKADVFEVNVTALNLNMLKAIYGLFSIDFKIVREIVDLYMSHMDNTQLTTTVSHQPTFDIENFHADSFNYEMMVPLKDRNVIANKETFYTVRKGYNIYPSVQIAMRFIVKGDEFEPIMDIYLPTARRERFLVSIKPDYNIQLIDDIIKKAIRQRVLCLLTTKKIKLFSRQDIKSAEFDDIGRYMTLIAMDTI
jgi:hypothetical protein